MVLVIRPSVCGGQCWSGRCLVAMADPDPLVSAPPARDGAPLLEAQSAAGTTNRLGTLLGVLVPVVLSQFSSLLFLRVDPALSARLTGHGKNVRLSFY
ncbi:hypothetical protein FJT64_016366 [Amphibalanus amphitrite]|uniref:Uncharacterized protein n=1 Tax=Amphibalanus amphitrite TaxID=1232801 RepID=A0A6A4X431_AMPAM|nr:hypothetical protein FJT64_016366 [Amphibalanus amphitrite]